MPSLKSIAVVVGFVGRGVNLPLPCTNATIDTPCTIGLKYLTHYRNGIQMQRMPYVIMLHAAYMLASSIENKIVFFRHYPQLYT